MAISVESFLKNPDKFGDVVILSAEDYEIMQEELAVAKANADIEAGRVYTHEEVFARLRARLEEF
jgi:PHD/YefM family antitoxin component YafN of YafNO toxin-antitoxin module